MKNHYLITQIADILMQLYLAWNPYVKELKQTIKNTSSKLLESFRRLKITEEDVSYILRYTTIYLEWQGYCIIGGDWREDAILKKTGSYPQNFKIGIIRP